jgi:NAD(P)-dependent dehydrogenase (short-subunit alcohol dehydrogenase family)
MRSLVVMSIESAQIGEWARHKIRVNAIAPGPVHTEGASKRLFPNEMIEEGVRRTIPLRRFASLEEVANAASYLLSDYASYVTGEALVDRRRPVAQRRGLLGPHPADGPEVGADARPPTIPRTRPIPEPR